MFYPEAVTYLEKIGVKRYKVASRTCIFKDPYSLETLKKISETRKPVIISMGMGGNKKKIQQIFSKNKIIFCYCISDYPLDANKIKWKNALKYNGFSDHTEGISSPIIYATLKKSLKSKNILIEKHVKLSTSKGPDAATSIDMSQLHELVKHTKIIQKI